MKEWNQNGGVLDISLIFRVIAIGLVLVPSQPARSAEHDKDNAKLSQGCHEPLPPQETGIAQVAATNQSRGEERVAPSGLTLESTASCRR